MNKERYKKYKPVTESYNEQEKTISKVKRAIDNFAGQITVNSDLEKEVGEFLLKKGISFMKDDSNLSKGKITFKLGYKKLKESYPINAFSDAQSKTFDRLDNILSKIKSLDRKYVPRKSIDGTDKVMLSKSGKDFVNIYKDGSFEILDDNGRVTAKVKDINDFSDNDIGVIFKKELRLNENFSNREWQEVASKTVEDSDGFLTDYVWYTDGDRHVFVFGDSDIYRPEDGEFDWEIDIVKGKEAESDKEAQEWFDSYEGFADLNENTHVKEEDKENLKESLLKIGLFS